MSFILFCSYEMFFLLLLLLLFPKQDCWYSYLCGNPFLVSNKQVALYLLLLKLLPCNIPCYQLNSDSAVVACNYILT